MDTGILPPAVRWVSPDNTAWLVERPPFRFPLRYTDMSAAAIANSRPRTYEVHTFDLPLPWTVMLVQFQSGCHYRTVSQSSLWCRNSQIGSDEDMVSYLPLPNLNTGGNICLGHNSTTFPEWRGDFPTPTVATRLVNAVNLFWNSQFNRDYAPYPPGWPEPIADETLRTVSNGDGNAVEFYRRWEKLSLEEVLTTAWVPLRSISSVLASYQGLQPGAFEHLTGLLKYLTDQQMASMRASK